MRLALPYSAQGFLWRSGAASFSLSSTLPPRRCRLERDAKRARTRRGTREQWPFFFGSLKGISFSDLLSLAGFSPSLQGFCDFSAPQRSAHLPAPRTAAVRPAARRVRGRGERRRRVWLYPVWRTKGFRWKGFFFQRKASQDEDERVTAEATAGGRRLQETPTRSRGGREHCCASGRRTTSGWRGALAL